ncbi:MAG TPA: hypothetical protein VKR43_09225 [Bryobacteraceae bacterium]|nr:hypothetical protein [Bryobacteraceae bacterium]
MENKQQTITLNVPRWVHETAGRGIDYHLIIDSDLEWKEKIDLTRQEYLDLKIALAEMRGLVPEEEEEEQEESKTFVDDKDGTLAKLRCTEFSGFAPDPAHHYSEDELLYMDADGDNVATYSDQPLIVKSLGTVGVYVRPETPPAEVVRLLRKIVGFIEEHGILKAGETGVTFTEHPFRARFDEHVDSVRTKIGGVAAEN